jgi:hypothetical protein
VVLPERAAERAEVAGQVGTAAETLGPPASADPVTEADRVQPGDADGQLQRDLAEHERCVHGPAERDNAEHLSDLAVEGSRSRH